MEKKISIQEADRITAALREAYQQRRAEILSEYQESVKTIDELSAAAHRAAQTERKDRIKAARVRTAERIHAEREEMKQAVAAVRQQTVWMPASEENRDNATRSNCHDLHRKLTGYLQSQAMRALKTEEASIQFAVEDETVYFTIAIPRVNVSEC